MGLNEKEWEDNTDRSRNGGRISVYLSSSLAPSSLRICFAYEPRESEDPKIPNPKTRNPKPGTLSQIFIYKTFSFEPGNWGWNPTQKP